MEGLHPDQAASETGDVARQEAEIAAEAGAGRVRSSDRLLKMALLTVSALLAAVLFEMWFSRPEPAAPVKFNFSPPYLRASAISPNGRYIAYVAGEGRGRLWFWGHREARTGFSRQKGSASGIYQHLPTNEPLCRSFPGT